MIFKLILYIVVFINAFGIDNPFGVDSFLKGLYIHGMNLYIVPYIFLTLILLFRHYNELIIFTKRCSLCITYMFLILINVASLSLSTYLSLFYLQNPNLSFIFVILRLIIYMSFFAIIPYIIWRYRVEIEKLLLIWVSGVVIDSIIGYFHSSQIGGFIYHIGQNTLGFHLSFSLFFVLFFIHKYFMEKKILKFLLLSGIFIFLIITSIFTLSKGLWLVIFFGMLFVVFIGIMQKRYIFSFITLTIIIVLTCYIYETFSSLIRTEFTASSGSGSNEERLMSIIAGLKESINTFFIGVGYKNYSIAIDYFNIKGLLWIQPDPHNSYVHIISEYGLLSLLSFLLLVVFTLKQLRIANILDKYIFVSIICMALYGNFTGQFFTQQFIYLLSSIILGYKIQRFCLCKRFYF